MSGSSSIPHRHSHGCIKFGCVGIFGGGVKNLEQGMVKRVFSEEKFGGDVIFSEHRTIFSEEVV